MADIGIRVVVMGVAEARRNIGAFQSDVTGLGRTIQSVSGTSSDLGRTLQSVGNAMVGVGRTLTIAVTAPIAAMGTAALEAGINFEDAFAGVGKTVEGVMTPMGELTELGIRLREEFRDLALEIPMATDELANLGELVGQLGVSADDVTEVTKLIAMLGETTELSAEDAARGLIQFNNIINGTEGDIVEFLESAGSALVALGNASVSTEGDILNIALRLAAAGERANFSAQEILAWSTTLSDLGVRAEMGGSAVSRMINEMVMAVQTGSDNLGTFANVVDMTVDEFVQAFEQDASGALLNFVSALEEGIDAGHITEDMLNDLGLSGVRVQDVLGRLRNAQELFNNNLDTANKAWREQIALQEEFNKRAATVKSQIQILKNAFTDLAITIFDLVKDDLKSLIDGIKQLVFDFKNLDPNMQKAIIQFALIAAAIGPVLIVLGSLVTGVGLFISGITALLSPVGLATAGILGLTAALAAIAIPNLGDILGDLESIKQAALDTGRALGFVVDVPVATEGAPMENANQAEQAVAGGNTAPAFRLPSFDEFIQNLRDLGNEDINSILDSFDKISASLSKIFQTIADNPQVQKHLADIAESFGNIGTTLKDFAIGRLDGFASWLEDNEDSLPKVAEALLSVGDAFAWVAEGVFKIGEAIASGTLDTIGSSLTVLLDILTGADTETIQQDWEDLATSLQGSLKDIDMAFLDVGTALAGSDSESFIETWQGNLDQLKTIFNEISRLMEEDNQGRHDSMVQTNDDIQAAFDEGWAAWGGIFDNIGTIINELGTQAASGMASFATNVVSGITTAVSEAQAKAGEMLFVGVSFIQNAINGVISRIGSFISEVSGGFSSAVSSAQGKAGEMLAVGTSFVQNALNGIKSKADSLIARAGSIIQDAIDAANAAAGAAAGIGSAMVEGIAGAISGGASAVVDAMVDAVMQAIEAAMAAAGIASPSKVTAEMGEHMIEGLIIGLQPTGMDVAGENAIASALSAMAGVTAPVSNTTNNNQSTNFNFGSITGVPLTSENSLAALLQERLKFAGAA